MVGKVLDKIGCKGTIVVSTVCFLICSITMAATPHDILQQNYGVLFMCAIFLGKKNKSLLLASKNNIQ